MAQRLIWTRPLRLPVVPIHPISPVLANFVRLSMISGQLNNNKPVSPIETSRKAGISRDMITVGG